MLRTHRVRSSQRLGMLLALGGILATPLVAMSPASAQELVPGLLVEAANDADGDGRFSEFEEVSGAGKAVAFRVAITNTGDHEMTVTSIANTMGETTLDLLDGASCPTFNERVLAPGQTAACTFTLDGYLRDHAPQPREQLTNVVRVNATHGAQEFEASGSSTVVNPGAGKVAVEVDATTDADGDGAFSDDEQAPVAGADVTFRVVVRNTSPGAVVITGLTDARPGLDAPIDLLPSCPDLDGMKLWGDGRGSGHDGGDHDDGAHEDDDGAHEDDDGGHDDGGHDDGDHDDGDHEERMRPTTATCTFTLDDHAPPAGEARTDTITAAVAKRHSPDRSAAASDTATVTTPERVVTEPAVAVEKRVGASPDGPFGDHDEAPGLDISIPEDGATVFYELEVTNTGDTVLTALSLDDPDEDVDSCVLPSELAPGATFDCVVGPVTALIGMHGTPTTVTATGAGRTVDATDAAHYRGTAIVPMVAPQPGISLTRSVNITPGADGGTYVRFDPAGTEHEFVTYRFTIENTGDTPLSEVSLTDERLGSIELTGTSLRVGQTIRLEVIDVIHEEDAEVGTIRSTARVRGTAPDGTKVFAEASEEMTVLRAEGGSVLPAVLPRAGASALGVGAMGMITLALGLSLLATGRGMPRRQDCPVR